MITNLLFLLNLVGTVAFAVSGAEVAIRKNMDLFGVLLLAVLTATGGGLLRDLMLGNLPPVVFVDPAYAAMSAVVALFVFALCCRFGRDAFNSRFIEILLFWFDTLGLAAFSVGGVLTAVQAGIGASLYLQVCCGMLTGVGGGILRDILAAETPDVLKKHIYASASIAGALLCAALYPEAGEAAAILCGMAAVCLLRCGAARYHWNLPRVP